MVLLPSFIRLYGEVWCSPADPFSNPFHHWLGDRALEGIDIALRESRREKKEIRKQQEIERRAKGKHPVFDEAMRMEQKRMKARAAGMAIVIVIILLLGGVVVVDFIHHLNTATTTVHNGIYFYVESARFVNSSVSWSFQTTVKNTGNVFISLITITIPSTGSTVGTISSISVGQTANGKFEISGITNGTIYNMEY